MRSTARSERFEEVYAAEHAGLVRFAGLVAADPGVGEDLAAEALARFIVASRRKAIDDPGAYLRRTVVNLVIGTRRHDQAAQRHAHRFERRRGPADDHEQDIAERHALWKVLGDLSAQHRAVLVLRFCCDQSVAEVAGLLDMAEGTVKSAAARGLDQLRAALEETGHD